MLFRMDGDTETDLKSSEYNLSDCTNLRAILVMNENAELNLNMRIKNKCHWKAV